MSHVIKNVKTEQEIKRFRALFPNGRAHGRGPRLNNGKEHQDCNPEFATHATLYYGSQYDMTPRKAYALTGWKGDKPIVRQLKDSNEKVWPYWKRRVA